MKTIRVYNHDWHTKPITIKDKTKHANGVPTMLNVMRQHSTKKFSLHG